MYKGDYLLTWWVFLIHDTIFYLILYDHIVESKKRFEAGKSYKIATIAKYFSIFIIILGTVVSNRMSTADIPMLINYDYKVVSGQVEWIGKEPYNDKGKLYTYDEIGLILNDEKEIVGFVNSPKLLKEKDDVECYSIAGSFDQINVIKINGRDVSDGYGKYFTYPGKATILPKIVLSVYLVGFYIFHIYQMRKKSRKYNCLQYNHFIYGYDIEKAGYKLWKVGIAVFGIFSVCAILGIGNSFLLGIGLEMASNIYAIGYLVVFFGRYRGVVYINGKFKVNYSNGWERVFEREDITYIEKIKENMYKIIFKNDYEVKVTLNDKKQEKILLDEQADAVSTYTLERLPVAWAARFVQLKKEKIKKKLRIVIPVNLIQSLVFIIVMSSMNPKNTWIFLLIFGVGTGGLGSWALTRVWHRDDSGLELIEKGKAQYAVIENLSFSMPVEFTTEEGEKITQTFAKDSCPECEGEKACVVYVPETELWYVEKAVDVI